MGWQDRAYNRDEEGGIPPVTFSMPRMGALTLCIMLTCLAVFLVQVSTRPGYPRLAVGPLERWLSLWFIDSILWFYQLITYQYLHSGVGHFFFNMIMLYFFLPALDQMWGWKKALVFYTVGGVVGGLVFTLMQLLVPSLRDGYLLGSSGSIFAAMGACALLMPHRQLILIVFPVPIRVAAALFAIYFLLTAALERDLSNGAHLGGLAFGFLAPWLGGPTYNRMIKKWHRYRLQRAVELEHNEQAVVDRILEKVSHHGMNSLTRSEKKALQRATERQRLADLAREKQWR